MTNYEATITLDIRQYLDYGLHVYDVDGKKVGMVDWYDRISGYILVRSNPLSDKDLYIPFSAITNIDPRDLFVSETRDELRRKYHDPPPRSILVNPEIDPDTGADESKAVTTEPSGYDGAPVVVDEANVGELAHHIAAGFHVYSSDMQFIGSVKQYEIGSGKMLVALRGIPRRDLTVPVAAVDLVDRYAREVYLSVSSIDLQRMQNDGSEEIVVEVSESS